MAYAADPGQKFDSDVHRRVLGHLSLPNDRFGWSLPALWERVKADVHEDFTIEHLKSVVDELVKAEHAVEPKEGIYQMSEQGLDALTDQPPAAEGPVRPATVGAATPLGESVPEAPGQEGAATAVPEKAAEANAGSQGAQVAPATPTETTNAV